MRHQTLNRIPLSHRVHIDLPLLVGLIILMAMGLTVLFSATGGSWDTLKAQSIRLGISFIGLLLVAQIPPHTYARFGPWAYFGGVIALVLVLTVGDSSKGAQRWLDLGIFRFQPSEFMKLLVPAMVAKYLSHYKQPPQFTPLACALLMVLVPTLMIAKQPDLGTALLVAAAGMFVLFFCGISWRLISACAVCILGFLPVLWFFLMKEYQRQRVMTFLNPEADPLGSGYQIIQSKIAIGSGGWTGKGWQAGTQSQLDFLPDRHTDFIFSVFAEEWGFLGILALIVVYLFIIGRGLWIAAQAQTTFSRLFAASISLTFFIYLFVNVGMVSGMLPVVGVPLPLVSFGGTSMFTLLASFGILMSIQTHRQLLVK